jgi:hypothetical protein
MRAIQAVAGDTYPAMASLRRQYCDRLSLLYRISNHETQRLRLTRVPRNRMNLMRGIHKAFSFMNGNGQFAYGMPKGSSR